MSDRADALKDLITSPGWLLFKEYARQQWGPEGYGRKVAQAITANSGTTELAAAVGKVHATTEEINMLMKWPDEELKRLAPKADVALSMYRGGR